MGLLSFLFPERRNSAVIARDRLKIVLAHERASRDAPDFLPMLQKELLDVVGRYVEINGAKVNLPKNGAAGPARPNPTGPATARITPASAAARLDAERDAPWVKPG